MGNIARLNGYLIVPMGPFQPFLKLEKWAKLPDFPICVGMICKCFYSLYSLSSPVVDFMGPGDVKILMPSI
jgi:hypothetical protein